MPVLDFKEIVRPNRGSSEGLQDSFELFARDFLRARGLLIVEGPSRGPDGGKDLIVEELRQGPLGTNKVRWLVTCKHKAHSGDSVGVDDELDLPRRLKQFKCQGLMPVYSTLASAGLMNVFNWLRDEERYELAVFDAELLETELLATAELRSVARRYMPISLNEFEKTAKPFVKAHIDSHDLTALTSLRETAAFEFRTLADTIFSNDVQLFLSPYVWAELFSETKGTAEGRERFNKKRDVVKRLNIRQHPHPSEMVAQDLYNVSSDRSESFSNFWHRFRESEVRAFVNFVRDKYRKAYSIELFAEEVSLLLGSDVDERTQLLNTLVQAKAAEPYALAGQVETAILLDFVATYEASEQLALVFIKQSVDKFEANKAKMYSNLQVDNLPNTNRHSKSLLEVVSRSKNSFDAQAHSILMDLAKQWQLQFEPTSASDMRTKLPHIRALLGFYFGQTSGFRSSKVDSRKTNKRKAEKLRQAYAMTQLLYAPDCDVFSADPDFVARLQFGVQGVTKVEHGRKFWAAVLSPVEAKTGQSLTALVDKLGSCYGS